MFDITLLQCVFDCRSKKLKYCKSVFRKLHQQSRVAHVSNTNQCREVKQRNSINQTKSKKILATQDRAVNSTGSRKLIQPEAPRSSP